MQVVSDLVSATERNQARGVSLQLSDESPWREKSEATWVPMIPVPPGISAVALIQGISVS
jgi:hypothetical protein